MARTVAILVLSLSILYDIDKNAIRIGELMLAVAA
jgi:hypothetical protein